MDEIKESGASTSTSSAQEDSNDKKSVESVAFDDHKRALDDMHRYKSEWKKSQEQFNSLKAELESFRNQRLAEKEDYKTLADQYKDQLSQKEQELLEFKEGFFSSKKYDSVYASALKAGLRKEAESDLNLLDLDGVEVERTDQGRVLVHGQDAFVEKLKQIRPHWFKSNDVPMFNSGGGRPPEENKPIDSRELFRLEKQARLGGQKDKERYETARKEYLSKRGFNPR